jgi:hypothetical protein
LTPEGRFVPAKSLESALIFRGQMREAVSKVGECVRALSQDGPFAFGNRRGSALKHASFD